MDWWNKLTKMWWNGEVNYSPEDPDIIYYYKTKHEIVKQIKPSVLSEIGVRAGYSSYAFLSAVPNSKLYAIDIDDNIHGGIKNLFTEHAPKVLSEFNVEYIIQDTQKLNALPFDVDFIHIDGDHSYNGCLHDLNISKNHAEYILVDDYDYIEEVKNAIDKFTHDNKLEYKYFDDHFRGSILIHTNFRRL